MNYSRKELELRLKKFALRVLGLVKALPKTEENRIYGSQILRSSSSIGANYAEAICSQTKKDFINGLNICRKETKETCYWLDLIFEANPTVQKRMKDLIEEGQEILKIFTSSVKTSKEKS